MTKEELKELHITRRANHQCPHCGVELPSEQTRETCDSCHKIGKLAATKWRWKMTREILDHYGYRCSCCGETEPMFLTIDHADGGGNEHRRKVRMASNDWYKAVIEEGFPDTYRVLCYNCNLGRERNGGICPHEEKKNGLNG